MPERQAGDLTITPAMIEAGAGAFARLLPDVEETLANAESRAIVAEICRRALNLVREAPQARQARGPGQS